MDFHDLTDQQLVEKILTNNQGAIVHFFQVRVKNVFTYIKFNLFQNTYIEVDDLIGEIYIYLHSNNWQKLREFQFRSKLSSWLSVVAFRYFRKKYSHLVRDNKAFEPLNIHRDNNKQDGTVEAIHAKIDLMDAINKIQNPTHKAVLFHLEIEGYDPEDIAKQLETTISNIYNIKSRAKKELQSILNEEKNYEK
jgi:RNA polymerase sigma factor (sigma-70 family)